MWEEHLKIIIYIYISQGIYIDIIIILSLNSSIYIGNKYYYTTKLKDHQDSLIARDRAFSPNSRYRFASVRKTACQGERSF